MELFHRPSKLNELTDELLAKTKTYREDPLSAKIKPEYILVDYKPDVPARAESRTKLAIVPEEAKESSTDIAQESMEKTNDLEPDAKKAKTETNGTKNGDKSSKKKKKQEVKLCSNIAKGTDCQYKDKCRFSHDLKAWLETKAPDIGTECYIYRTHGYCPFGLSCRFSADHVEYVNSEAGELVAINKKKEDYTAHNKATVNFLSGEVKEKLWKKKYDFKRSVEVYTTVDKYVKAKVEAYETLKYSRHRGTLGKRAQQENAILDEVSAAISEPFEKVQEVQSAPAASAVAEPKIGCVTDEDLIRLRTSEKKKIDWKHKTYLAPLTTNGNLPYRRICKEYGVDITCSEMAMCTNLLSGQVSEWALLKRHASETIYGVQLCGSYNDTLTKASQLIMESCSVDFIDLNVGCPIDLVFNKGAGCALMTRMDHLQKIVRSLDTLLDVPVTVKIRTGIKEDTFIAHELIPELKNWGASMITLHGRTRQQRYSKLADWAYIDRCSKLAQPVPFFGCGDILSHQDYYEHVNETTNAMIARGALYKPWLFTEIKEKRDWDISAGERFDMLQKYANYGMEHWGSDNKGVETTRRFMLEWLSFLYRYIPIGVMETLPQRINLRPPFFMGRNELETLFASPACSDWIKITEFFLGPVQEGFSFKAKHSANAY